MARSLSAALPDLRRRLPRRVLFFGLPLVLGLVTHALFQLVDTLLVGQLDGAEGAASIAVTGLCDPVTTLQTILYNGPIAGAGVLLAAHVGARDREGLSRTALRGTGFVLLMSAAMGVPGYFLAEPIARAMGAGQGGDLWQLSRSREYLELMLGAGFTAGMFLYLTTLQRAIGRTGLFLGLFVLSNLLNFVLGLLLIYGPGPHPGWIPGFVGEIALALGIPRLGVMGSAWSTVLARGICAMLALLPGIRSGALRGGLKSLFPAGRTVKELLRLGFWSNGQIAARGLFGGVVIRCLQAAGGGNPYVVAGVFVGMKVELVLILIAFGWGSCAQTLVATSLGADKPIRAAHEERLSAIYALLLGGLLALPVLLWAPSIASVFNPAPELVDWAALFLRIGFVAFVVTPVNVVVSQTMVARRQLRTPVVLDSVILLGLAAPALVLATVLGAPVWTLLAVHAASAVVLTVAYTVVRLRPSPS